MDLYVDELFKNIYGDPFLSHRFVVDISGEVVASFSQCSGIKMQVQTIQARSGSDIRGVQEYVPVLTRYEPITLSKGVIQSNKFLDWLEATSAGRFAGPTGYPLRRTIEIVALDDAGNRGVVWTLYHAMPISYELSQMDASSSAVLTESVTFAYTAMERDYQQIKILNTFTKKPHKKTTRPTPTTPTEDTATTTRKPHAKVTRITPAVENTTPTTPTTPKHGKVTKVTPVPVTPNTHKRVTRVTATPVQTEGTAATPAAVPGSTHKRVTRVTPVPITPNSHRQVTRASQEQ